jgi:hypothetical protein
VSERGNHLSGSLWASATRIGAGSGRLVSLLVCCLCAAVPPVAAAQSNSHASHRLTRREAGEAYGAAGVTLSHGGRGIAPEHPRVTRQGARGSARPAARPKGRALTRRFTATSRTYVQPDGSAVTRVFSQPVNFRAANGSWQPINDIFVPAGPNFFVNRANSYRLFAPRSLAGGVRVAANHGWVRFALRGAKGQAVRSGNTVRYRNALPGVSLEYAATMAGAKESLRLSSRSAPARFVFSLGTSRGVKLRASHHQLIAVNRRGKTVLRFAAPFA